MKEYLVEIIVGLLGFVITTFLIPYITTLTAKIKDEKVRNALNAVIISVGEKVVDVVQAVSQTVVKDYIRSGQWNSLSKQETRDLALKQIKALLSEEELAMLIRATNNNVDDFLLTKIEAVIADYKPNN